MRVLLAVVILALICAPTVWANGTKVTPPTVQPPVAPPTGAGPTMPPCVCPPLPAAISAGTTTIPLIVPVLVNRNLINSVPCVPNVSVLIPTSIDCTMANKILACNSLAVVMVPVTVPLVASQAVTGRMLSGAGPCPISIDQTAVNNMLSGQSIVVLPLVSPVPLDEKMFTMASGSQPIMMLQSSFTKIGVSGQPVMIVPMAVPPLIPGATIAGRGPSMFVPLSRDAEARVLNTGTVWVATQMDRPTLNSMISSNTVQMVVPMMVPIAVAGAAPSMSE